jgi:hypothetical protein
VFFEEEEGEKVVLGRHSSPRLGWIGVEGATTSNYTLVLSTQRPERLSNCSIADESPCGIHNMAEAVLRDGEQLGCRPWGTRVGVAWDIVHPIGMNEVVLPIFAILNESSVETMQVYDDLWWVSIAGSMGNDRSTFPCSIPLLPCSSSFLPVCSIGPYCWMFGVWREWSGW